VRDAESRSDDALVLDYYALRGIDRETRLCRLTAWVLAAESGSHAYVLRIPGSAIGPGIGAVQRSACLRALALLPDA
jgi:hypothetical protein